MVVQTTLSHTETWSLLGLSAACIAILFQTFSGDGAPLIASIAFSGLAFAATYALIRWLGGVFIRAGLKGKDMAKKGRPEIPETMGAICAVVYIFIIITFIPFPFYKDIVAATSGGGNRDLTLEMQQAQTGRYLHRFPHSKLASYLSAILSLQAISLLGIADDLFDIRWRHKVLIPAFASIPMLIVYFVDFGVTSVVIPTPLQPYLGQLLNLGFLYYGYMSAICIFSPNSINILAGINGIEVAQSVVVAILILVNDLLYILPSHDIPLPFMTTSSRYSSDHPHPATDSHLFSIYLLLPFLGVSLALLSQNWYPARVFVGDTYCYFAGMVFAVVAILGHFSKTLLVLLVPQIFNFIYSAPQLFGLVPCPRHRLPKFNARTGLLENSWAEFTPPITVDQADGGLVDQSTAAAQDGSTLATSATNGDAMVKKTTHTRNKSSLSAIPLNQRTSILRPEVQVVLKLLHALRLVRVQTNPVTGEVLRCTNLTILNLWLVWFGPMREDRLALGLLGMQVAVGLMGLLVRHRLALLIFPADNL